jgi:PAS domain S-box-containing protein
MRYARTAGAAGVPADGESHGSTAQGLLGAFVKNLPGHGVVLLDVDGKILSWNEGAAELLGFKASEVLGRDFIELCNGSEDGIRSWRRLLQAGRRTRQDSSQRLRGSDGAIRSLRCVLQPVEDAAGTLAGFGCMLRSEQMLESGKSTVAGWDRFARMHKTILVVDDSDQAREVAADRLMSLGYSVIQAANGDEALRILESNIDIDVLLTDVVMPGDVDGGALAREAQLLRPALKVLFMSGYLPHALVSRNQIQPDCAILVKPYSRLQLGEQLQTLLPD